MNILFNINNLVRVINLKVNTKGNFSVCENDKKYSVIDKYKIKY